MRAKVEHPFRVIKRRFDHRKDRHRGLPNNTSQIMTLFALSNIWVARKVLFQRAEDLVFLQTAKGLRCSENIACYGQDWLKFLLAFRLAKRIRL